MLGNKYIPTATSENGWVIAVAGKTCPQKPYNTKKLSLMFKNLRLDLNKSYIYANTGKYEASLAIWVSSSSYDIINVQDVS